MSGLLGLKVMTRGLSIKGWILLAGTWAHPQWRPSALSFLFSFSSPSGKVFAYSFDAFYAIQNAKLRIRGSWYQLIWREIWIWEAKCMRDENWGRNPTPGTWAHLCMRPSAFLHFSISDLDFSRWQRYGCKIYSNHESGMMKMMQIYNLRMILSMFFMMDDR